METENKRWPKSATESSYTFCQSYHYGLASYCHIPSTFKHLLLRKEREKKGGGGRGEGPQAGRVHAAFVHV